MSSSPPAPTTAELLARLVGFDTTSRHSNLALIDHVRDYLGQHGVTCRIGHDPTGTKANLHAIIGPLGPGGIALSGHVDTVPVDGQDWTSDPFTLTSRDGRLFGRGTSDMKGFVACALAAVPGLLAAGLARPVHLLITYDEEVGCMGAWQLSRELGELLPRLCIVGEPTDMQPVLGHKGRLGLRATARGRPGHSSEPARGVNAIYAIAAVARWAEEEAARAASEGPFAVGFDPPHSTIHVGTIAGGTALNIIPEHAQLGMEIRDVPGDPAEARLARLVDHARTIEARIGAQLEFETTDRIPGMSLPEDHELTTLVRQLTGSNSTGRVSYGTEAGIWQQAGIPTIVCGPGSIRQAHQPDEWIAPSQLDACDAFIRRLATRLAA